MSPYNLFSVNDCYLLLILHLLKTPQKYGGVIFNKFSTIFLIPYRTYKIRLECLFQERL